MTTQNMGATIDHGVLGRFLEHCYELSLPEDSEFEMERYIERMDDDTPGAAEQLRHWQSGFSSGAIETDWCRGCWSVQIRGQGEDDELTIIGCEECAQDVCEVCHWHVPGPRNDDCLCWVCAPTVPVAPNSYERHLPAIRRYHAYATAGGWRPLSQGTLTEYLSVRTPPLPEMLGLVGWFAQSRRRRLWTGCCPGCGAIYIGHHPKDVELTDRCENCGRTVCPACTGRQETNPTVRCRRCVD